MEESRGLAGAAGLVVLATILSRILGVVRERAIAGQFGAGAETDVYVGTLAISTTIVNVLGAGVSAAILPLFTQHLSLGRREAAWRLASNFVNVLAVGAFAVTLVGWVGAGSVVRLCLPGLGGVAGELATRMLRLMLPIGFGLVLGLALTALLHAHRRFAVPAFAPVLTNLLIIASVGTVGARWGIMGLAAATTAAMFAQVLVQVPALLRRGAVYRPVLELGDADLRRAARLMVPAVAAGLVAQAYSLGEKAIASRLAVGSIAALNFAYKLLQLPLGVFAAAVSTVIFPALAAARARGEEEQLGEMVFRGLGMVALVIVPAAVGLAILRVPVVSWLYERGEFGRAATQATSVALVFYCLGMVGHAANAILVRVYHAGQDTVTPVKVTLVAAGVGIGSAYALSRGLGHAGVALGNSLFGVLGAALYGVGLRKLLGRAGARRFACSLGKIALSAGLMALALSFVLARRPGLVLNRPSTLELFGVIGMGLAAYGLGVAVLGVPELRELAGPLWRRISPGRGVR